MDEEQKVLENTDVESEERNIVKVGSSKGVTIPAPWFKIKRFFKAKVRLSLVKDEGGRLCVLIEKAEGEDVVAK